jgi:hypothetical protein
MTAEIASNPIHSKFRDLNPLEKELMKKLLDLDLPARDALLAQLNSAQVRTIDESGSLEFSVRAKIDAAVMDGPIVNAVQTDSDSKPDYGPFVNYVLFVKRGRLQELQIYKDDGSIPIEDLDPSKIFEVYRGR